MIKVIDFQPEHASMIKRETYDPDPSTETMFMGKTDCALIYAKLGKAITVMDDDKVLGIGGVVKVWNGMGEVWCRVSDEGRTKHIAVFKAMKAFLDWCLKNGFHRIQTCIAEEHLIAHRCILRLGFIPEGMKIHYGPNKENFVGYVRFA